jgi:two-component system CheB/CheR fusion protein
MNLISCRNLFIYLQPEAQARALETFHFALNPDGLLLLGASESLGENGLFVVTDEAAHRLYGRGTAPYRALPRLSAADPVPRAGNPVDRAQTAPPDTHP